LDTEIVSFSAQKIAKELADDMSNQATKAGLKIQLDLPNDPIMISSSYQRVREILMNFLTNAIKYSSGYGRNITIKVEKSRKYSGGAIISVIDEGIGISPADQKRLFRKFFRSADKKVQQIKGTGLGLYITIKQANKIGASIMVNSKLNHGSTFSLEIPAKMDPKKIIST
jgi:signal transduction histidine kinase